MSQARVFLLLGGIAWGGLDGYVTSAGMFILRSMLNKIPGVTVTTYTWGNYEQAYRDLAATPDTYKRILIGYSGGGSRATWICDIRPLQYVDLLVGYDPSPEWQTIAIGDNVKQAICYYNTKPMQPSPYGWLGGGSFKGIKNIVTHTIAEQHLLVQKDMSLHTMTYDAVRALMS